MDETRIRTSVHNEGRSADNIFVHSFEKRGEAGQQLATNEDIIVPEEHPVPEFLGFFPSWSPSQAPTTGIPNFSVDELSTTFAESCPSISFDQNQDSLSWNMVDTTDPRPVASLRKILPLNRNEGLAHEIDWNTSEESFAYAAEASLVWLVVSLGLGFWLILLCLIVKATTSKFNEGLSKQLRRPSFEDNVVKKCDKIPSPEKGSHTTKSEQRTKLEHAIAKTKARIDDQTRKIPSKPPSKTNATLMELSQDSYSEKNASKEINEKSCGEGKADYKKTETGGFATTSDDEGQVQLEPYWSKIQKMRNSNDENGATYFLTPILPVMSDLSLPPGLSKSSSSSSSSTYGSKKYCRGATDEASIEVLATDDIYTGAHTSNETSTPVITYLTYCLEEDDSNDISNRRSDLMYLDNESDILLLSSETMDSGSSKLSNKSHPLTLKNSRYLERAMQSVSDVGETNRDLDLVELARSQTETKYNFQRTQESYFHLGERGRDDVECIGRVDGEYFPTNEMRNPLYRLSSNQVVPNNLIGQSGNLAMLLQCDDSNTTIDLLADSDSNDSSEDRVNSKHNIFKSNQEDNHEFQKSLSDQETEKTPIENQNSEISGNTLRNPITQERVAEASIQYTNVEDITGKQSSEYNVTRPVTEDLEALLFATDIKSDICGVFVKVQNQKGSSASRFLGSLHGRRMIMVSSCLLLIVSVILFLTMGISPLHKFQKGINLEFDSLMDNLTRLFSFDDDDLYAFLGELDRRKQRVYLNLNEHCPRISSKICTNTFDSTSAVSSSCNLEGIPFREAWNELLLAFDGMEPHRESSSQRNSYDPLSTWWITVKNQSLSVSSTLRNRFRNEAKKLKWCLSIALIAGVGMSMLAMAVLFVVILPMCEKRWDFNWKETLPYFKFGDGNQSWNVNRRFSFCTGRIFAVIFWTLFGSIWLVGMTFTIMMVATVDVCGSEYPNAVLGNEFERWEEMIPGFDFYITDFWQQQLRYCGRAQISGVGNNIYPEGLMDRIDLLSNIIGPVHDITVGLEKLSSSGFYPNVCGRDIASLLQATKDMELQLCSDAEFHTNAFVNLMSCDNSSWLPLYNRMAKETICTRGLGSLAWTVATQVSILFCSLLLWSFRSVFLVSRNRKVI